MATEYVAADITGSGLVTAALTAETRRVTSHATSVLSSGVKRRFTLLTVKVLRAVPTSLEVAITGSALLVGDVDYGAITEALEADLTGSATVGAPLTGTFQLAAAITGSATVGANLSALYQLVADITGSATVGANVKDKTGQLVPWGGVSCSATVWAYLDTNLVHADNTLVLTQSATVGNEHVGNTLQLTQSATVELVSNLTATNDITFTQTLDYDAIFTRTLISVLGNIDHVVIASHTLPVQTASSTIVFTQDADYARLAHNTINFTQLAVGTIGGIDESASNDLILTDLAIAETVINFELESTIVFSQVVLDNIITEEPVSNTIAFKQNADVVQLEGGSAGGSVCEPTYTKQYVYLQAPFEGIEATVVLPAPVWGDTENITSEMILFRSMNGGTRTLVKTNSNRRLNYTFRLLERSKAIELLEFLRSYDSDVMRLVNWKGEVWRVNLLNNPSDFVQTRRFGTDISLEFEGEKLYG